MMKEEEFYDAVDAALDKQDREDEQVSAADLSIFFCLYRLLDFSMKNAISSPLLFFVILMASTEHSVR